MPSAVKSRELSNGQISSTRLVHQREKRERKKITASLIALLCVLACSLLNRSIELFSHTQSERAALEEEANRQSLLRLQDVCFLSEQIFTIQFFSPLATAHNKTVDDVFTFL
jgi:hypothetical protein